MRLLLIALLFTLSAVAEKETVTPRKVTLDDYKGTVPNSDDILYENLRRVKNQEVDAYLIDNPATKQCKDQTIKNDEDYKDPNVRMAVRTCFRDKLDQLQDTQIEKISEDLNLVGYGVVKDNSVPAIKDYFDERLEKALYGEVQGGKENGGLKKITKQKFVDHSTFLDLYESQIGKSTLHKISEFCLMHDFNISDNTCVTDVKEKKEVNIAKCYTPKDKIDLTRKKVEEMMKSDKKDKLRDKWQLCAMGITLMCREYGNAITKGESAVDIKAEDFKREKGESNISFDSDADMNKKKIKMARHACNLVKHMKEHRKVTLEITEQRKEYNDLKHKKGVSVGSTFKSAYNSKSANSKSIDELTTIASDVIAGQYDDTQDKSDAEACAQNGAESDECKKFFKTVEDQDQEKLILDYELKAMAQVKQYNDSIKDLDQAKLKEQLEKDGDQALLKELENKTPEEIKEIMYQRYKAERMAIVNDLWKRVQEKEVVQEDTNAADKIANIKEEIDTKKERIRGLYHYSNIVTSYLTFEGSDKTNTVGFAAEQENFEEDENEANQYFQDLQPTDMDASNSGKNQTTSVNLGFIDSFLHKTIDDDKNGTNP